MKLSTELLEVLRQVRSVGVITGAGISAESGIQTYRGKGGIYDDPVEGDRTIEALSAPTVASDPDRTWRSIARMAEQAREARPSAGHRALVQIERVVERFVLLTQNVDGLHREAGSENVIEIHGTISRSRCMQCDDTREFERTRYLGLEHAPRCEVCEGVLRPDVVLFGEFLDTGNAARMQAELSNNPPDLILGVGTTGLFPYIVEPVLTARREGNVAVEINPEPTDISAEYHHCLRAKAGDALPLIANSLAR